MRRVLKRAVPEPEIEDVEPVVEEDAAPVIEEPTRVVEEDEPFTMPRNVDIESMSKPELYSFAMRAFGVRLEDASLEEMRQEVRRLISTRQTDRARYTR